MDRRKSHAKDERGLVVSNAVWLWGSRVFFLEKREILLTRERERASKWGVKKGNELWEVKKKPQERFYATNEPPFFATKEGEEKEEGRYEDDRRERETPAVMNSISFLSLSLFLTQQRRMMREIFVQPERAHFIFLSLARARFPFLLSLSYLICDMKIWGRARTTIFIGGKRGKGEGS